MKNSENTEQNVDNTQVAYQINDEDNVATALTAIAPGIVILRGAKTGQLMANKTIPMGHKIALTKIHPETPIIKYGIEIGIATKEITPGDWIHLHAMRSAYDERSSYLDLETGAPKDISYE